jgi:penicillin-binding protein 1C
VCSPSRQACAGSTAAHALPGYEEVKAAHRPSDTLILDRQGEVVHRLRVDKSVRRGPWVPLADISPALRTAMVLSEDKRFYEHSGVDWRAVSSAAWGNLWNERTRGASTLTMQLAGLLEGDWAQRTGGRSVAQKLGQTVAAQVLDRRWRKDQVLEAYLNLVPFRGELVGIDALSRSLFGKAPHGLDESEAAIAAALVRSPNARAAQVAQRACGVLQAMQPPGRKADCEALDLQVTGALQRRGWEPSEGIAPHWARRVLAQPGPRAMALGGAAIQTSLRADLQRFAVQTLQRQLRELRGRHVEDGALVVLDNASGEVLAWVGSSGILSGAAEVDGVLAARQPGSTLKPFLYAQAIAERRLTAASLLEDSPAHLPTASGLYIPQNYDRQFKGWVSVRTALGASLNVPAVRTLVMVSPGAFHRQLRAAGLPLKQSGDYYGYSLALGSAEVPLLDLTNAYRTLANGGRYSEVAYAQAPARAPAGVRPRSIRPRPSSWPTSSRTRTRAPAPSAPTACSPPASGAPSRPAPARTCATTGRWLVRALHVGVWVGNAGGAAMHDVSGTSGARRCGRR